MNVIKVKDSYYININTYTFYTLKNVTLGVYMRTPYIYIYVKFEDERYVTNSSFDNLKGYTCIIPFFIYFILFDPFVKIKNILFSSQRAQYSEHSYI